MKKALNILSVIVLDLMAVGYSIVVGNIIWSIIAGIFAATLFISIINQE